MPGVNVGDGGLLIGAAGLLSPDNPPAGGLQLSDPTDGVVAVQMALPAGGLALVAFGVLLS